MSYVNLLDVVYPVGSLYIAQGNALNAQSPAATIGGTWEAQNSTASYPTLGVFTNCNPKQITTSPVFSDIEISAHIAGNMVHLRLRRQKADMTMPSDAYIPTKGVTIGNMNKKYAPVYDWATVVTRVKAVDETTPVAFLLNVKQNGEIVLSCDPDTGHWVSDLSVDLVYPLYAVGADYKDTFNDEVFTVYKRTA